jgi:hypothetical protein
MGADATVTIGADASQVERAALAAKGAWSDFGHTIQGEVVGAARLLGKELGDLALASGRVSFSSQQHQVREFEASTARMAVSMGRDLEGLRGQLERTGHAIGRRPGEVAAWASEVGKLSYSFQSAADEAEPLAALAAKTGRSLEDYKDLGVALSRIGVTGKDAADAIGVMAAQAEGNTRGGVAALSDQLAAAGEQMTLLANHGKQTAQDLSAFFAVMGRGLDPAAASRVGQQSLGAITGDPRRWERYLGHHILDEHGHVDAAKLPEIYQGIYGKAKRQFGSGETLRNVLINNFGAETGMAILNAGKGGSLADVAGLAHTAPSGAVGAAQAAALETDAGKRARAESDLAVSARELMGSSTLLGRAADSLQQFSSHNPILGTFAATAASNIFGGQLANLGKRLEDAIGGGSKAIGKGGGGGLGGAFAGAGGKLAKGGAVLGAGLAGYEIGTALDEQFHISDKLSHEGGLAGAVSLDAVQAIGEQALAKSAAQRRENVKAIQAVAHAAPASADLNIGSAAAQAVAGRGGAVTGASIRDELKREGRGGESLERAARAIEAAMQRLSKITIVNGTGGPIEVAGQGANSPAAGSQTSGG